MAWVEVVKRSPFRASGAAQPSLAQETETEAASVQAGSLGEVASVSASAKAPQSALPAATWEAQLAGVVHRRMLLAGE
jgi:hypothetical protein